jgi:hypothetical protein
MEQVNLLSEHFHWELEGDPTGQFEGSWEV